MREGLSLDFSRGLKGFWSKIDLGPKLACLGILVKDDLDPKLASLVAN